MQEFLSSTFGQVLVQAIGFIAMGLGMLTFQAKTRSMFLVLQTASVLFWGTQFLLLGSLSGALLNVIGLVRNILYSMRGKRAALSTWVTPACIIAAVTAVTVFSLTQEGYPAIILGIGMILQAIAYFCNDPKKIRLLSLLISPVCLVYNAIYMSLAGIIGEILNLTSVCIAIYRFRERKGAAPADAPSDDVTTLTEASSTNTTSDR